MKRDKIAEKYVIFYTKITKKLKLANNFLDRIIHDILMRGGAAR